MDAIVSVECEVILFDTSQKDLERDFENGDSENLSSVVKAHGVYNPP